MVAPLPCCEYPKRYGFSARVPVSILTDFEEFRVFDCTRKPFHDKPKVTHLPIALALRNRRLCGLA